MIWMSIPSKVKAHPRNDRAEGPLYQRPLSPISWRHLERSERARRLLVVHAVELGLGLFLAAQVIQVSRLQQGDLLLVALTIVATLSLSGVMTTLGLTPAPVTLCTHRVHPSPHSRLPGTQLTLHELRLKPSGMR
ncbi:hypothetical protein [Ktedonospora formicarum]|uniref:hypothetical protein n=1 Tax=Ktedonospora formicarum TaxID=2778364 RepID=UPI001C6942F9|nr:hypothetical protein [Ktedonospora formicarum]